MDDLDTIPIAATILRDLAIKPREQIQYTSQALPILSLLKERNMVSCREMPNLPEQNIWTITVVGISWLERHELLP